MIALAVINPGFCKSTQNQKTWVFNSIARVLGVHPNPRIPKIQFLPALGRGGIYNVYSLHVHCDKPLMLLTPNKNLTSSPSHTLLDGIPPVHEHVRTHDLVTPNPLHHDRPCRHKPRFLQIHPTLKNLGFPIPLLGF